MANGIAALGTLSGRITDAVGGASPAMAAPQNQDQQISFMGARKESTSLMTGIVLGAAFVIGTIILIKSK